jgi:poly-gamma-glutamate capsule biosynthesis protein CapA/YwtB (metallophosphatase superfamily)
VFGIAVALSLAACAVGAYALTREGDTSARVAAPRVSSTTTTTTTTVPVPTTIARDPLRGSGQPVTFAFGGDVHFEGALRTKLLADPNTVLASIAPTLSAADFAMVNLETAVTEGGTAVKKQYVFRAPAAALDALRAAGVDVATEANNHGLDYGPVGLADALAARQAKQFPVVGIGANATEAYTPYRVEVKGQRIAAFGATDVIDGEYVTAWSATDTQGGVASAKDANEARLVAAVQAARVDSDTVVVFLHWGEEGDRCPNPRQKALAQSLVNAGADIIVGSHSHHVEGAGRLGTAFVGYGLGNFIFYNESGEAGRSGVLRVTATGRTIDSYDFVPARIRGGVATPSPAGSEADEGLAHFRTVQACTGLTP